MKKKNNKTKLNKNVHSYYLCMPIRKAYIFCVELTHFFVEISKWVIVNGK